MIPDVPYKIKLEWLTDWIFDLISKDKSIALELCGGIAFSSEDIELIPGVSFDDYCWYRYGKDGIKHLT